jgi:hypothetical protein
MLAGHDPLALVVVFAVSGVVGQDRALGFGGGVLTGLANRENFGQTRHLWDPQSDAGRVGGHQVALMFSQHPLSENKGVQPR